MITDSNQALFAKMSGRGLQEGVLKKRAARFTYKETKVLIRDF